MREKDEDNETIYWADVTVGARCTRSASWRTAR